MKENRRLNLLPLVPLKGLISLMKKNINVPLKEQVQHIYPKYNTYIISSFMKQTHSAKYSDIPVDIIMCCYILNLVSAGSIIIN